MAKLSLEEMSKEFSEKIQQEVQIVKKQKKEVEKAINDLEEEKKKMSAFQDEQKASQDIVVINVGGKIISTKRGTLLMAQGSLLEALFSGRWEESLDRDDQGRPFFDFSPQVFRLLLSHLRVLRDASPTQKIDQPVIPPEIKAEFMSMVSFLGVKEYIYGPVEQGPPAEAFKVHATHGTNVTIEQERVNYAGNNHFPLVGNCPLHSLAGTENEAPISWKVHVKNLPPTGWFYAGIIAAERPANNLSYSESTSFGWASANQVYVAGANSPAMGGWGTWQAGDEATFKLDDQTWKLEMKLDRASASAITVYTLQLQKPIQPFRLHLNMHAAAQVSLKAVE